MKRMFTGKDGKDKKDKDSEQTYPDIRLKSPNGQRDCEGLYKFALGLRGNGMPVWKHEKRDLILFSGSSGKWYVFEASTVERSKFKERAFFISAVEVHNGKMPYEMNCAWRLTNKSTWKLDNEVKMIPDAGGFKKGDVVFWAGGLQTGEVTGEEIIFGMKGEIQGTSSGEKRVDVVFNGHTAVSDVPLAWIARKAPTFPGDYQEGDIVFFNGGVQKFPDGDKLTFGMKGQIVGKAGAEGAGRDQRVQVRFQGNKGLSSVYLSSISRAEPDIPGGFVVGSIVSVGKIPEDNFANGDYLAMGLKGMVVGRSTQGDGEDDLRLECHFDGNQVPSTVFLESVVKPVPRNSVV